MSSNAIFVCNDCREAKESVGQYPGDMGRVGKFKFAVKDLAQSKYKGRYKDMEEWISEHCDHDSEIHSDAHGTFLESDYDFDKKDFVYSE